MRVMVENVEGLEEQLRKTREAQAAYAKYSQEEVDKIFLAAATDREEHTSELQSQRSSGSAWQKWQWKKQGWA